MCGKKKKTAVGETVDPNLRHILPSLQITRQNFHFRLLVLSKPHLCQPEIRRDQVFCQHMGVYVLCFLMTLLYHEPCLLFIAVIFSTKHISLVAVFPLKYRACFPMPAGTQRLLWSMQLGSALCPTHSMTPVFTFSLRLAFICSRLASVVHGSAMILHPLASPTAGGDS